MGSRHGRLSYFHTNRRGEPECIAPGGEPVKLGETTVDTVIRIAQFTWADDGKNVKVFVEAEHEPRAVQAAGDGKGNKIRVSFAEHSFCLEVAEGERQFRLQIPNLCMPLVPSESRCRVSEGKRITVVLRKEDVDHKWFALTKSTAVEKVNAQVQQHKGESQ